MRAYERLLKYVKVHTTSDPNSGTHPSTLRQFDLAKILVEELKELGLTDAHVDEHCYVYATLPATPGQESAAPLGLIAHMGPRRTTPAVRTSGRRSTKTTTARLSRCPPPARCWTPRCSRSCAR